MLHNDWPAGTFGADRRNLALFVNRGGGIDFTAGIGLTDREPEVAYPQMDIHDNSLLISYSQGACGLRNIRAVRVSPLPDPGQLCLYPRANLPPAPQCVLTNGTLLLGGGRALKCRVAPAIPPCTLSMEAWINPDDDGVLFDNRGPACGFVWGLSGVAFVHLGDPAKNIRSTLPVPRGRWSRVGVAIDYPKGAVTFSVNDQTERVTFKPGRRSLSGTSATLFGPNPATSSLTAFEGALRSLILDGTNRLFDASEPTGLVRYGGRYEPADKPAARGTGVNEGITRTPNAELRTSNSEVTGKELFRLSGAASAGVELDANERSAGDAVELTFVFLIERGDGQTLATAGDANQPARVLVRGTEILLCANGQTQACGAATPGAWQRLALTTRSDVTRVALDGNPPVEVRHTPEATWLYLGEGYRPATPVGDTAFVVEISTVRSRVIQANQEPRTLNELR
jgi:hypothetical protein